jgi:DMSO/TMAO reductase YedYZ molybdopterin-dependent catalytic subunit
MPDDLTLHPAGTVATYKPRKAPGLPPGQRLLDTMPWFSDAPHRPPPRLHADPTLSVACGRGRTVTVTSADLQALRPREQQADFHCVTTWSVTGLNWTGVPLRDVLESVGLTEATAPYLVARAADGRRAVFTWQDATTDDVMLVTHLDGVPLDARHGAPLRLVSPRQYGYKSLKHLTAIEARPTEPQVGSKEHLRARVAAQERHPRLPSWAVRRFYRLLIAPTALIGERTLRRDSREAASGRVPLGTDTR